MKSDMADMKIGGKPELLSGNTIEAGKWLNERKKNAHSVHGGRECACMYVLPLFTTRLFSFIGFSIIHLRRIVYNRLHILIYFQPFSISFVVRNMWQIQSKAATNTIK